MLGRHSRSALLFIVGSLLLLNTISAEVFFERPDGRYELKAVEATPDEIFTEMENVLGIPFGRLPGDQSLISVHTRSADLEKVLTSVCESFVVIYGETPEGEPTIDAVEVTPSVDTEKTDRIHRQKIVNNNQLQRTMNVQLSPDVEYGGIGASIRYDKEHTGLWLSPLNAETPAAKAGIRLGDKALSINGTPIQDFPNQQTIAEAIRGPVGSPVSLLILKPDGSRINQVVMRAKITGK